MEEDIWDPINALIDDAQRDQEFKQWWNEVDEWLEKVRLLVIFRIWEDWTLIYHI